MPELLGEGSQLKCPHGGTVSVTSSNTKSKANGEAILRSSDTFKISGCSFSLPPPVGPHPCLQVKWVQTSAKSKAGGDSTLTKGSTGMCVAGDQAVQGTVMISSAQSKAGGR
jgi:hypothetical protein